jgi:hypothetical protein
MAITAAAAASGLPDSLQRGLVGASFGAGEVSLTRPEEVSLTRPELVVPCCSAPAGSRPVNRRRRSWTPTALGRRNFKRVAK